MLAVAATEFGGFEQVAVIEVEPPALRPGDVRVAVRAAGVNPVDVAVLSGYMQPYMPATLPVVLGYDVAGLVTEVGDDVGDFQVGDAVAGSLLVEVLRVGSFAETVVAQAEAFVPMPAGMDFVLAAAVPHVGLAASQAIEDTLHVQAGDVVLIHAAAGGVGSMAIQLARRAGATVIGTCSATNDDHLTSLGAQPIRYDLDIVDQVRAVAPDGVDVVLDLIGNQEVIDSMSVLKAGGRLASLVNLRVAELGGQLVAGHPDRPRLAALVNAVAAGDLTVRIAKVFPLRDTRSALELIAGGHVPGKLVITVDAASA